MTDMEGYMKSVDPEAATIGLARRCGTGWRRRSIGASFAYCPDAGGARTVDVRPREIRLYIRSSGRSVSASGWSATTISR